MYFKMYFFSVNFSVYYNMSDSEEVSFESAKTLYIDYASRIADIKAQLKPLQKELKKNERIIKSHMEENDLESLTVGEYTFEKKTSTRFRMTKEELAELLEDPTDADQFDVETVSFARKKRRIVASE